MPINERGNFVFGDGTLRRSNGIVVKSHPVEVTPLAAALTNASNVEAMAKLISVLAPEIARTLNIKKLPRITIDFLFLAEGAFHVVEKSVRICATLSIHQVPIVLAHELIHFKQFDSGYHSVILDENEELLAAIWKGVEISAKEIERLKMAGKPYENLPWETEAYGMQEDVATDALKGLLANGHIPERAVELFFNSWKETSESRHTAAAKELLKTHA